MSSGWPCACQRVEAGGGGPDAHGPPPQLTPFNLLPLKKCAEAAPDGADFGGEPTVKAMGCVPCDMRRGGGGGLAAGVAEWGAACVGVGSGGGAMGAAAMMRIDLEADEAACLPLLSPGYALGGGAAQIGFGFGAAAMMGGADGSGGYGGYGGYGGFGGYGGYGGDDGLGGGAEAAGAAGGGGDGGEFGDLHTAEATVQQLRAQLVQMENLNRELYQMAADATLAAATTAPPMAAER